MAKDKNGVELEVGDTIRVTGRPVRLLQIEPVAEGEGAPTLAIQGEDQTPLEHAKGVVRQVSPDDDSGDYAVVQIYGVVGPFALAGKYIEKTAG